MWSLGDLRRGTLFVFRAGFESVRENELGEATAIGEASSSSSSEDQKGSVFIPKSASPHSLSLLILGIIRFDSILSARWKSYLDSRLILPFTHSTTTPKDFVLTLPASVNRHHSFHEFKSDIDIITRCTHTLRANPTHHFLLLSFVRSINQSRNFHFIYSPHPHPLTHNQTTSQADGAGAHLSHTHTYNFT